MDRLAVKLTRESGGLVPDSRHVQILDAMDACPERGPAVNAGGCCPVYECRAGKGTLVQDHTYIKLSDCYRCCREAVGGPPSVT